MLRRTRPEARPNRNRQHRNNLRRSPNSRNSRLLSRSRNRLHHHPKYLNSPPPHSPLAVWRLQY
jgi:hypothetical protein